MAGYFIRQHVGPGRNGGQVVHLDLFEVVGPDGVVAEVPVLGDRGNPIIQDGRPLTEARPLKLRAARRLLRRKQREASMNDNQSTKLKQAPANVDQQGPDKDEPVLWWRKVGGGSLRLRDPNRIIKPNQKFQAKESEIPSTFRNSIIPIGEHLDPDPPLQVANPGYTVKHAGGGWYVIEDAFGKQVTENKMRKPEADARLVELLG